MRMVTSCALAMAAVVACSSPAAKKPAVAPPPDAAIDAALPPPVTPVAWTLGTYAGDAGSGGKGELHVVASLGATYAVWLAAGSARIWIVDEAAADQPELAAWSFSGLLGKSPAVGELPQLTAGDSVAVFGQADGHTLLTLRHTALGRLALSDVGAAPFVTGELAPVADAPAAPELEAADRAFAAATAARGPDGWVDAADDGGVMYRRTGFVIGKDAIRTAITATLGSITLEWEPSASGLGPDGTLGFTVGHARWTDRSDHTRGETSYVTLWRKQPDGTWRFVFDTGRPR